MQKDVHTNAKRAWKQFRALLYLIRRGIPTLGEIYAIIESDGPGKFKTCRLAPQLFASHIYSLQDVVLQ